MSFFEILLLAVALSCDAMVCSVIYGQRRYTPQERRRNALMFASAFGAFQFLMPVTGFFGGGALLSLIEDYDHWVAFGLLLAVSFNMVKEALGNEEEQKEESSGLIKPMTVLVLAVATSLDALAVGMSIGTIESRIFFASAIIGIVCFSLSLFSFYAATPLSHIKILDKVMNLLGALVLALIGIKVLIEHGVFANF